jgi:DNA-binding response OmpR family regulator
MTSLVLPGTSVLLVCGEAEASRAPAHLLVQAGFRVSVENDGAQAMRLLETSPVDLVLVLCGGAHSQDALDFTCALRRREPIPIVGLFQGSSTEEDHVRALEAGADDCLAAACGPREAVARISAVLRRVRWGPVRRQRTLEVGKLTLDLSGMAARFEGRLLHLTQYEFELLRALAEQAGRVLTREELMERAKGNVDESFDRSIDVHICRLRAKLGDVRRRPRVLKTVRGVGYVLEPVMTSEDEAPAPTPAAYAPSAAAL